MISRFVSYFSISFALLFAVFAANPCVFATDSNSGIRIESFEVTEPSPGKVRFDMAISEDSDLFRSFCVSLRSVVTSKKRKGKPTVPKGFFLSSNGNVYLDPQVKKKDSVFIFDDGPRNENHEKNKLRITLDTSKWPKGRYVVSLVAMNRPSPGSYVAVRRMHTITIGNPSELVLNGGSNIPSAVHREVYNKDGIYACFPGLVVTPEGDLFTSFGTRTRRSHIDPAGGSKRLLSKDGGVTWQPAPAKVVNRKHLTKRGDRVNAAPRGWVYADASKRDELIKQGKRVRDVREGKIAYLGGANALTWNKEKNRWDRTALDVPEYVAGLMGYHQAASAMNTDEGIRLVATYGRRIDPDTMKPGPSNEVFLLRSEDDGLTWEVRPMYKDGLTKGTAKGLPAFDETALLEAADGTIIAMMRTAPEDHLYQANSTDGGKTWSRAKKTPILGWPCHLLKLRDGRILCSYGYRREPMGIRACLSSDNGKTWDVDREFILRSDGLASPSDLGYPISHELPDGQIMTIYYHTTNGHNTHIATTHWKPHLHEGPVDLQLVSTKKVWDHAPHNAFTDLIRYKDKWFVTFRESSSHMYTTPAGDIRILSSEDGEKWESAALIKFGTDADDLRDSKLSITPDGRLMLICALAPKEDYKSRVNFAYFSEDGTQWDGPYPIAERDWWLWRVAWSPKGVAYGIGYSCFRAREKEKVPRITRLYRSEDGRNYEVALPQLAPQTNANEAGLIFRKDGSAVALIRRDPNNAVVGTAKGDYSKWDFKELNYRIGGPDIIETPNGHLLVSGRLYDGKVRTSVGLVEPEAGKFTELLKLPSGGDCSYPGMVFHDGHLWVSYYSSHEGKTGIYFAKIKVIDTAR